LDEKKLLALPEYRTNASFDERERAAIEYADKITLSSEDVDDVTFSRLRSLYAPAEIVELTAAIAFENLLSKFHRALRVEQQDFCARLDAGVPVQRRR
jgi:alkylhydroperoxidase family enzyme